MTEGLWWRPDIKACRIWILVMVRIRILVLVRIRILVLVRIRILVLVRIRILVLVRIRILVLARMRILVLVRIRILVLVRMRILVLIRIRIRIRVYDRGPGENHISGPGMKPCQILIQHLSGTIHQTKIVSQALFIILVRYYCLRRSIQNNSDHCTYIIWYLITHCARVKENRSFSKKKQIRFVTALDPNKCFKEIE